MYRQTNGSCLVHQRSFDGLPNPPGRISGKTKALLRIKLADRVHEPEIAFFDQVQQRQTPIEISSGNPDHQAQIAFDHSLAGSFVTAQDTAAKKYFFLGSQ